MDQVKYNLTERQKELFDYLSVYQKAHGTTPTQVEVAAHFQISQSNVAKHLAAMERRGWAMRRKGMKNALVLLD